jgi:hypothetical protein
MRLLKQTMAILGSLMVIGVIVAAVAPKTAQAIVSTFVQVTNTPTTAVPTVIAPAASQLYGSSCGAEMEGPGLANCSFTPVPAGQTLIAETLSIRVLEVGAATASTPYWNGLTANNALLYVPLFPQGGDGSTAPAFTGAFSGRLEIAGSNTSAPPACFLNFSGSGTVENQFSCFLTGYLVPAQ